MRAPGRGHGRIHTASYARLYGHRFHHGHFYRGHHHRHWTRRFYHHHWRTWFWYCPSTYVWYYWSAADGCYYPVNYITYSPPTVVDPDQTADLPPEGETIPEATPEEQPNVPSQQG